MRRQIALAQRDPRAGFLWPAKTPSWRHFTNQVVQLRHTNVNAMRQRGVDNLFLLPLVRDTQRLGKIPGPRVTEEDRNREGVNRARALRRRSGVIRGLFRQLGCGGPRERQQLDACGRIASEQAIDERHQRRTFPGAWPSEDARVLVWVMCKNRCLLVRGHVGHRVRISRPAGVRLRGRNFRS